MNLFQPSVTIDKTGDTLSKIGDDVTYTITVNNTSSADTPALECTVSDPTIGFSKPVTLASGASDVSMVPFTIPAGATDPFLNTATVTCSPTGFPNVLTDSDGHSVNLFQPSVTIDKTGDTLSKIGDDVTYTITVNNTSSADTPALECTVSDPTIGLSKPVTLASGASDVSMVPFTIPAGATDPFLNTATVTCSPTGFPNVLTDSDGHSVNLFQPSVTIDKTGDTLSKIGDDVTYTITVNNTSSADTPALECTVSDPTIGLSKPVTLASGASDVSMVPFTIPAGATDPFLNTATVTCSPTGFPNVLTDSDGHSVNLFQPAIAVDKAGDTLSKAGDDVSYTFTLSNNSSADTPPLDCTATDSLLGVVFDDVLPLGNTVRSASRTVLADDPDPLNNTVTLVCGVTGFPNVLQASDSHSVDLVHPGLAVAKECAPATVSPGATINYECTISNTGDVALDVISIDDSLKGDLTDPANFTSSTCGPSLDAGTSCTITYTFIAPSTPGLLTNTVTATYRVHGLPNVVMASDSCTVEIIVLNEGCTPGFWRNHTELWDENSDTVSQNVKAAVDAMGAPYFYDPAVDGVDEQLFRNIFGLTAAQMTAAGLDPNLTMEQGVNLGGGGFDKLARHGVAALLSSAAGISYPFSSDQVLTMVHDAVVNLMAEPTAQNLADANDLGCPLS